MKVINIIGHSCSGKTTFISRLVVKLKEIGPVATIKHLGHHSFSLDKGKDTTIFFEQGIHISTGIDSEKTVLAIRNNNLIAILDLLADQCIEFTVIEGFKTAGLPAVVIGDLDSDNLLFRNPTLDDLMHGLEKFPEYNTLNGIEAGLKTACPETRILPAPVVEKSGMTSAGIVPVDAGTNCPPKRDLPSRDFIMTACIPVCLTEKQFSQGYKTFNDIIDGISREISEGHYQVRITVGIRNCWDFPVPCEVLIAVAAEDYENASIVISAVHERIMKKTAPWTGLIT